MYEYSIWNMVQIFKLLLLEIVSSVMLKCEYNANIAWKQRKQYNFA